MAILHTESVMIFLGRVLFSFHWQWSISRLIRVWRISRVLYRFQRNQLRVCVQGDAIKVNTAIRVETIEPPLDSFTTPLISRGQDTNWIFCLVRFSTKDRLNFLIFNDLLYDESFCNTFSDIFLTKMRPNTTYFGACVCLFNPRNVRHRTPQCPNTNNSIYSEIKNFFK